MYANKSTYPMTRQEKSGVSWSLLDSGLLPQFTAYAYNTYTKQETDAPLPVTVLIEDENDNPPQFSGPMDFAVQEQCPMGK